MLYLTLEDFCAYINCELLLGGFAVLKARRSRAILRLGILPLIILSPLSVSMATTRVVAIGDSITTGYSPTRLQNKFNGSGFDANVFTVASGGCDSNRYTGKMLDPSTNTLRNYADEVLALDPDVIIFLLGTNDAIDYKDDPNAFFGYSQNMSSVFDKFGTAKNSHGESPLIIISSLLPVLSDDTESAAHIANKQINDSFNPWLIQQTQNRGFLLKDMNTLIQQQGNWQDYYNDGIHLWANDAAGYEWMAEEFRDTVISAVPEPATITFFSTACIFLLHRKRRRLNS